MIVCIISLGSFLPTDSRLFHTIPLLYVFMCVCVWTHAPHDMDVKAGGQRLEIGSLLLPYGSPGSNSGWHIWQQAPLPCEPSQSPREVSVSSTTGLFKDCVAWQSVGFRMVFRELGLSSPPKPTSPRSPGSLHLISVGSSG